ncbi:Hypothetical_protein [Hexamita inflata]|uniref:Hypothetical_protein n=1 Tax=Hexamita inflata TaxID=28002 RepID=A0AA86N5L9_9EUKA|nr:Hypothetical protein HINF_LOCUS1077 [Hexamita inflata]
MCPYFNVVSFYEVVRSCFNKLFRFDPLCEPVLSGALHLFFQFAQNWTEQELADLSAGARVQYFSTSFGHGGDYLSEFDPLEHLQADCRFLQHNQLAFSRGQ